MGFRFEVRVKPNAKVSGLEKQADGTWIARVKAPPLEGKANEAVIRLVSEYFGVNKAQVLIRIGMKGRLKQLEILGSGEKTP
jgi:uncharacterized protein (TIGR00251 family)